MPLLEQIDFARLVIFALVLARVGGLMLVAPVFGSRDIPANVRALLAAAASLLVFADAVERLAQPAAQPR